MDPSQNDDGTLALPPNPIAEDAVEMRVNPDVSWPEELEGEGASWAWSARQAFDAAQGVFTDYCSARSANEQDKRLTAQGAHERNAEWVAEKLPQLRKQAENLREQSKRLDDQLQRMTETALKAPEDVGDGIRPADVRAWLLTIPEKERAERAQALIRQGDKTVLRTVLCTPPWMTGIPAEELEYLREDVIKASDPERYRKIRAVQKGITAAERAVEGTMRFLQQDSGPNAHQYLTYRRPARPGLRRVG